jgi:CRISPR-associated endoribonuclease Cas6
MRLLLRLEAEKDSFLPLNYNYLLSAAIYKQLRFGSEEFSTFLHELGYPIDGRSFKLFTFALRMNRFTITYNAFRLDLPFAELIISTPISSPFFSNFLIGAFENQRIEIANHVHKCSFAIKSAEALPDIEFLKNEKFMLLTPMVLSKKRADENAPAYYLRPEDIVEANRILNVNLIRKYILTHNSEYRGKGIRFNWNERYLREHPRVTKKITIEKDPPVSVIGVQSPFDIEGDPDLISIGYECGFGEKNSMGFGMVERMR